MELSGKILKNTDILNLVRPFAQRLSEACDETVHFVKRSGESVLYLDKVEAQSVRSRSVRLSSQIGLSRPMYCSGVGKAILAQLSDKEVEDIWNSSIIEKKTDNTIVELSVLKKELKLTLKRGYALDNEENELGIRCIAVPVFDYRNEPVYALSVSTLIGRMPDERLKELGMLLQTTASDISKVLGSNRM